MLSGFDPARAVSGGGGTGPPWGRGVLTSHPHLRGGLSSSRSVPAPPRGRSVDTETDEATSQPLSSFLSLETGCPALTYWGATVIPSLGLTPNPAIGSLSITSKQALAEFSHCTPPPRPPEFSPTARAPGCQMAQYGHPANPILVHSAMWCPGWATGRLERDKKSRGGGNWGLLLPDLLLVPISFTLTKSCVLAAEVSSSF